MNNVGYSGTPLAKKLGIKQGCRLSVINAPDHYFDLLTELPEVVMVADAKQKKDLVHYFATYFKQLQRDLSAMRRSIEQNGAVWISWSKKASKVETDITEDLIRKAAIENGLVDVKVCAVDQTWSGLKLVIPLKDRK